MCGLVSLFSYGANAPLVRAEELDTIRDAMIPRGPDGAGSWISSDRKVGLGHRRLAILDISDAGAQPMASADGRVIIAFNGEIYNFAELRAELEQQGASFRSRSDTEVLIELYRRLGPAMLERLRGMFAFALWDEDRRGLLLARDPFGIKPLYVADDGMVLRAASQVKALLAGGAVDRAPSPAGHASFCLWGHVTEPFTLFRNIRALPAGNALWLSSDGSRRQWEFGGLRQLMASAQPKAGDLREALLETVGAHMVADVPVGVFLSGGLDSTTIASLAAEQAGGRLRTLTLGFDEFSGSAQDETPLAAQVAAEIGADHAVERVTAADFAANRQAVLAAMDQPSIDGINTWFVARAAARRGLKVALSGLGGDELFGGYDSFHQIPKLVRALRPLGCVPFLGRGFRLATAGWLGRFTSPKLAGLLEYGANMGDAYLLRRGLFMPWELPQVLGPDMARAGWAELNQRSRLSAAVQGLDSDRLRVTALEAGFYMRNQLLRDSDWAGMAHSLEIRVPLVDTRLYLAVLNGGFSKLDMARCARPALPDNILHRPKTGFFIPVSEWIQAGQPSPERGLRGWARAVLAA